MEVFEQNKQCDLCQSTEGVRKMMLTSAEGKNEEKYLCASCVMAKNFKAYLVLAEQKNKP